MKDRLAVYWGRPYPVGHITRHRKGNLIFSYSPQWLEEQRKSISLSLPCRKEAFPPAVSTAFFENLLPENETKHILAFNNRFDPKDSLAFLHYFGKDCAGALSILPEGDVPDLTFGKYHKINTLLSGALARIIVNPQKHKLFTEIPDTRLSIAGVQDKLPVFYSEGNFFLPENEGSPTSHIIKPQNPIFPHIQRNEAFCMDLAANVGLVVPKSDVIFFEEHELYIVERFDRAWKKGKLLRVHQEDFCQALGCPAAKKYQEQGGPGFKACRELIDEFIGDDLPVVKSAIVSAMTFNTLIGNNDAHAKNFSILHSRQLQLAPFYDLVSTEVYPSLERKTAMSIGDTYRSNNLRKNSLEAFANHMKLRPNIVFKIFHEMTQKVEENYVNVLSAHEAKNGKSSIYRYLYDLLHANIKKAKKIIQQF